MYIYTDAHSEVYMNIIISNLSGKPIYEQIYDQIKAQIMSGVLSDGEALPSMRALAAELKISIITTKRAYEDLERDGYLVNVQGKGCFVKGMNPEMVRENLLFSIQELFEKAVDMASVGGISFDEMEQTLKLVYMEKNDG